MSCLHLPLSRDLLLWIATASVLHVAPRAWTQTRQGNPQQQKVYLAVHLERLSLVWNGDQGESGRGSGEVYLGAWLSWPSRVEHPDPQNKEVGPLNGDVEFPSGTIREAPPGSGTFVIEPATVLDKQFGQIYYNQADCPVSDNLLLDVLVWDEDSNKNLSDYQAVITMAAQAASAAGVQGAALAAGVVNALIGTLTASSDDALGRNETKTLEIPDPCDGAFEVTLTVPLENLAKDLWRSVDAEDQSGTAFSSRNVEPPDEIGSLELRILGGPKVNKFSSSEDKEMDPLAFLELTSVDLGQADESIIAGVLTLGANLPLAPPPARYRLFLDIDNDLNTGAQVVPFRGAEFALELAVESSGDSAAAAQQFDPATQTFVILPGGVHDAEIDVDRRNIHLSVSLAALGNPPGPIAGWGTVETDTGITSVLPEDPAASAPLISISTDFTGVPPLVVSTDPPHDAVDVPRSSSICVTFSKSMDRASTEAAFGIAPPVAGSFSWQGNRLCFQPAASLSPFTTHEATIDPSATDSVGTPLDGDVDRIPGAGFSWRFTTVPLPLLAADELGSEKGQFFEDEPIFVTGSDFPPLTAVDIYLVENGRPELVSGSELSDVTGDGPTPAMTDGAGTIPVTGVGSIGFEGEFNAVVDVDLDGRFDPTFDRVDRTGIGLFVLPRALPCDADADGDTDVNDVRAILALRNTPAEPGDPLDVDGDGLITVADARLCTLQCTNPNCQP